MSSETNISTTEIKKKSIWNELEAVYRNSVAEINKILKKNKNFHFFETKDGWDDSTQPISGITYEEMTPEEIIVWMYENEVSPRSVKSPYIYTDREIRLYRENRDLAKIEDWKNSIEFCKEQIRKYENRISEVRKNTREGKGRKNED
jgi:hypothetical protein